MLECSSARLPLFIDIGGQITSNPPAVEPHAAEHALLLLRFVLLAGVAMGHGGMGAWHGHQSPSPKNSSVIAISAIALDPFVMRKIVCARGR